MLNTGFIGESSRFCISCECTFYGYTAENLCPACVETFGDEDTYVDLLNYADTVVKELKRLKAAKSLFPPEKMKEDESALLWKAMLKVFQQFGD